MAGPDQKAVRAHLSRIYRELKAYPSDEKMTADIKGRVAASKTIPREVAQKLAESGTWGKFADQQVALRHLALQCKEEEFVNAVTTGELPPVKLKPSEMDALRGGIIPILAYAGYAAVAGLVIGVGYYLYDTDYDDVASGGNGQ